MLKVIIKNPETFIDLYAKAIKTIETKTFESDFGYYMSTRALEHAISDVLYEASNNTCLDIYDASVISNCIAYKDIFSSKDDIKYPETYQMDSLSDKSKHFSITLYKKPDFAKMKELYKKYNHIANSENRRMMIIKYREKFINSHFMSEIKEKYPDFNVNTLYNRYAPVFFDKYGLALDFYNEENTDSDVVLANNNKIEYLLVQFITHTQVKKFLKTIK